MNNDLISRNALIQHAFTAEFDGKPIDVVALVDVDNAPTVPLPDFKEGYKQAIIDGKTNFSRAQGEWIKGREISRTMLGCKVEHIDYRDYTCSNCGLVLDNLLYYYNGSPFYKFCPNCGADMRKGGSDNEKSSN